MTNYDMMRQVSQELKKPIHETQEIQLSTPGGHHESWEQGAAPGLRKGEVGEKDEEGRQSSWTVGLDKRASSYLSYLLTCRCCFTCGKRLVQTCASCRPQMLMLWCVLGRERLGGTQGYMLTQRMDVR